MTNPLKVMPCAVPDCDWDSYRTNRMCLSHYRYNKKHGTLEGWTRVARPKEPVPGKWGRSKNGYLLDRDGYERTTKNGKTVSVHKVVMEEMLGRPLTEHESVHHKNNVKHDNRPENLELWTRYQPAGHSVADALAWAKEIIELYS